MGGIHLEQSASLGSDFDVDSGEDFGFRPKDVPLPFTVQLLKEGGALHHVVELADTIGEAGVLKDGGIGDIDHGRSGIEVNIDVPIGTETNEMHPQRNEDVGNVGGPTGAGLMANHGERKSNAADRERGGEVRQRPSIPIVTAAVPVVVRLELGNAAACSVSHVFEMLVQSRTVHLHNRTL